MKQRLFSAVTTPKFVNLTRGINDFLLAGIKRVTTCAHFDIKIFSRGRLGLKGVTATAMHGDFGVRRVDIRFHFITQGWSKMGAHHTDYSTARQGPG